MGILYVSPKTLPIFLDYNSVLYENGAPAQCCVVGYHSVVGATGIGPPLLPERAVHVFKDHHITGTSAYDGSDQAMTYIFATDNDPITLQNSVLSDIQPLSHEIAEWYNDPFATNLVPYWQAPKHPHTDCSDLLEVGEPLVGVTFTLNGYHLQDEAFLPWFAQQTLPQGQSGHYSYLGTLTTPALSCTPSP